MYQENNVMVRKPESSAKKFWRVVFGTMVGFFLSCIILSFLSLFFMIGIMASLTPSAPAVKDNSILKMTLQNQIVERSEDNPFDGMDMLGFNVSTTGLNDILECIDNAATDPKIKGIYLNTSYVSASPATLKEIRDALVKFKSSGKFIYSYSENYSQGAYYLSSAADKMALNLQGGVDFRGYAFQTLFYKGLIEKLNVDVQVIRHGEFKSAVEPFLLDKMSAANREQMTLLAGSMWNTMLQDIEASRNISRDSLNIIADNLLGFQSKDALNCNLVDQVCYYNDVEDELKQLSGITPAQDLSFISVSSYKKSLKSNVVVSPNTIAVIYAVGDIVDGKGGSDAIGSETFTKTIRKAYEDDKVKAIVLRINSPGGSALASEIMWKEIEAAKKAGKKVITSMGDYAASGGYYMACNSDAIVAQPNTLTGSIGVFGMIPSFQNALKNKLGVTVDVVRTNPHADLASGLRKMDDFEIRKMQASVEETYSIFIQRVADGRNMTTEQVDKIGQGRVWAGSDALGIGLVDKLGNIQDAITLAAELAELDNYKLEYYPKQKEWFTRLLEKDNDVQNIIREELGGDLYFTYSALKQIMNSSGVQARMPMEMIIE